MNAWIALTLTCWLCALLAQPRQPLHHDEAQILAYRRLRGRQALLIFIATLASALTLFLWFVRMLVTL